MKPAAATLEPMSPRRTQGGLIGIYARLIGSRLKAVFSQLGLELRHVPKVLGDLLRHPSPKLAGRYIEQTVGRNFQRIQTAARIPPAELDNLGLLGQARRSRRGVLRVTSQRDVKLLDYDDLTKRVDAFYDEARGKNTFGAFADCQWVTESLGWAVAAYAEKTETGGLRAVDMEKDTEPIMHFGIGMYALCNNQEGDVARVEDEVNLWSDEDFKFLSYDGLGLLLASADSGIRELHDYYETRGVPTFRPPEVNNVRQFVEHLEEDADHMLCRGYGRGLYFLSGSLNSAVKAAHYAADKYGLSFDWLAEGVGFAFAMVNSPCAAEVIRAHENVAEEDRDEVIEGIADNLHFNEFSFPGFLDRLENEYGKTKSTERAREQARLLVGEDARVAAAPAGDTAALRDAVDVKVADDVKVTATVRLARAMRAYKGKK